MNPAKMKPATMNQLQQHFAKLGKALCTAAAVLMVSLLAYTANAFPDSKSKVLQGSKAAGLESCVRETPDMRRNHMQFLKHKRDQTMREGIRTEDMSLNGCIACHAAKDASGAFVPVTDEGQFCESCHTRVGETLDCFQCHRTTPDPRTDLRSAN